MSREPFAVLALCLLLAGCSLGRGRAAEPEPGPPKTEIRGTITFVEGAPYLRECRTKRRFRIGRMAPGTAMRLEERYVRLSRGGQDAVLAELAGVVQYGDGLGTIEQPSLLKVYAAKCQEDR